MSRTGDSPPGQLIKGRTLRDLLHWAEEQEAIEARRGKRVLWAPCHMLGPGVSLRNWLEVLSLESPERRDGAPAAIISADVLILVDPDSADEDSLKWLSGVLASTQVEGVGPEVSFPRLVLLLPGSTSAVSSALQGLLDRFEGQSLQTVRVPVSFAESEAAPAEGLSPACDPLLAILGLLPIPVHEQIFRSMARSLGVSEQETEALLASDLVCRARFHVLRSSTGAREPLHQRVRETTRRAAAQAILEALEPRLASFPDARIPLLIAAGRRQEALEYARRRLSDHLASMRYEAALGLFYLANEAGLVLGEGPFAAWRDEAVICALYALTGRIRLAGNHLREQLDKKSRLQQRETAGWLALAAAEMALRGEFPPREADSLLRRAVRLATDNEDWRVRLTLARVKLLHAPPLALVGRADWLLRHISRTQLEAVSTSTMALYLEETVDRLMQEGNYAKAFRKLRRLAEIASSGEMLARAYRNMAVCRARSGDREASRRYVAGALRYAFREASPDAVRDALRLRHALDQEESNFVRAQQPLRTRKLTKPGTNEARQPEEIFRRLEEGFSAALWLRRRDGAVQRFGREVDLPSRAVSVFEEEADGVSCVMAAEGVEAGVHGVVLHRAGGSDLVIYRPAEDMLAHEEAVVRLLLSDAQTGEKALGQEPGGIRQEHHLARAYLQRAAAGKDDKGLLERLEGLFLKDLLLLLESEGLSKDEMASRLGVSRATLYRMYARCGLN